jgi:group I intron endonuclease
MQTGVYQIQSSIKPYRLYIGSSKNIMRRWAKHLQDLRLNKHHSPHLQWHYNKYGEHDLLFSILEHCGAHALINREQHYIDIYNPFFNSCKEAGNTLGYRHTEEAKKKISDAGLGNKYTLGIEPWNKGLHGYKVKPCSDERREKARINNKGKQAGNRHPRYGKHCSDVTKQKISQANIGRVVSPETRDKIRAKLIGRTLPEEQKEKISKSLRGKKKTDKHRENIRKSKLKKT